MTPEPLQEVSISGPQLAQARAADPRSLADQVAALPSTPGVYLWSDASGKALYIGKAKRLRQRVRSYLSDDLPSARHVELMRRATTLEVIGTPTEADALILEQQLISSRRPPYNVALVEGGGYPWIAVTLNEPVPRVLLTTTRKADGAHYIGPWTSATGLRDVLQVVRDRFGVRTCAYNLPVNHPERPCLEFDLGRCGAPCVGRQSVSDYRRMMEHVVLVLEGKAPEVIAMLEEEMRGHASRWEFEAAATLRNTVAALRPKATATPHVMQLPVIQDVDVFGLARDGNLAVVVWLQVRAGRVAGQQLQVLEGGQHTPDRDVMVPVIHGPWCALPPVQSSAGAPPPGTIRPSTSSLQNRAPTIVLPLGVVGDPQMWATPGCSAPAQRLPRGIWGGVSEAATTQARHVLDDLRLSQAQQVTRTDARVAALQQALSLPTPPRRIVTFDIAHDSGKGTVASCVRFENGQPRPSAYRAYRMRTVEGVDDPASIREAVLRWALRVSSGEIDTPDLVVIDGGITQLSAAKQALEAANVTTVTVVSLAKREELIYRTGEESPLKLPRHHAGLLLLQHGRDEAHRFANTKLRTVRTTRLTTGRLPSVQGIGPATAKALLKVFGSVPALLAATDVEILAAVPRLGKVKLAAIRSTLTAPAGTTPSVAKSPRAHGAPLASLPQGASAEETSALTPTSDGDAKSVREGSGLVLDANETPSTTAERKD